MYRTRYLVDTDVIIILATANEKHFKMFEEIEKEYVKALKTISRLEKYKFLQKI